MQFPIYKNSNNEPYAQRMPQDTSQEALCKVEQPECVPKYSSQRPSHEPVESVHDFKQAKSAPKYSSRKTIRQHAFSLALVGAIFTGVIGNTSALAQNTANFSGGYKVSQAYSFGNLSVFLIKGPDKSRIKEYLTLPEAIAKKQVVVNETGNVNVLSLDNLSGAALFIQSGEIVKGGRQDRAVQSDMIIPPSAKNVSLPCFCVEHGRWSERVGESASKFGSATDFVVGNEINKAIQREGDQGKVWEQVSAKQNQLSRMLAKPVASLVSPSSLQLTLEQKSVKDATQTQYNALADTVTKEKDAVGYAVAINGKISNADIYGSGTLFRKLWPGLLRSAVTEAVAQRGQTKSKLPTEKDVKQVLADAEHFKRAPNAPSLQGATNGTIGPQAYDATVITGVNTAGAVRPGPSPFDFFSQTADRISGTMVHQKFVGK